MKTTHLICLLCASFAFPASAGAAALKLVPARAEIVEGQGLVAIAIEHPSHGVLKQLFVHRLGDDGKSVARYEIALSPARDAIYTDTGFGALPAGEYRVVDAGGEYVIGPAAMPETHEYLRRVHMFQAGFAKFRVEAGRVADLGRVAFANQAGNIFLALRKEGSVTDAAGGRLFRTPLPAAASGWARTGWSEPVSPVERDALAAERRLVTGLRCLSPDEQGGWWAVSAHGTVAHRSPEGAWTLRTVFDGAGLHCARPLADGSVVVRAEGGRSGLLRGDAFANIDLSGLPGGGGDRVECTAAMSCGAIIFEPLGATLHWTHRAGSEPWRQVARFDLKGLRNKGEGAVQAVVLGEKMVVAVRTRSFATLDLATGEFTESKVVRDFDWIAAMDGVVMDEDGDVSRDLGRTWVDGEGARAKVDATGRAYRMVHEPIVGKGPFEDRRGWFVKRAEPPEGAWQRLAQVDGGALFVSPRSRDLLLLRPLGQYNGSADRALGPKGSETHLSASSDGGATFHLDRGLYDAFRNRKE